MAHQPSAFPADALDPHHELEHAAHGHVILRLSTLVSVLMALLFFTVLTVGQAQFEIWFSNYFNIHLPHIVNAVVVLTIAVIKATLVALFFMQLKYDSPLNAVVLLFSLSGVGLFLGISMIDLGSRAAVLPQKHGEIQRGGMGIAVEGVVDTGGMPIVEWARARRIEKIGEKAASGEIDLEGLTPEQYYWQVDRPRFVHERHHAEPAISTPDQSRPPEPVGPALFVEPQPDAHGHGAAH